MGSKAVKRIEDVRGLRGRQFNEDAGPMAHPIRPESYISMDNFYTATVYSKGAGKCRKQNVGALVCIALCSRYWSRGHSHV
jgi:aminopeptidase N